MRVIADAVDFFLCLIEFLIFARCIMSWIVDIGSENSFCRLIFDLTEIFLAPVRNFLDKTVLKKSFIDFSPMIVCSLIELLKIFFSYIL